ncbi:hypothetical protein BD560DRAFT_426782 [Blakeslea trispora]|nr:hypothetical protein BD560DRAFT_426782 [Blakeslea trispora]
MLPSYVQVIHVYCLSYVHMWSTYLSIVSGYCPSFLNYSFPLIYRRSGYLVSSHVAISLPHLQEMLFIRLFSFHYYGLCFRRLPNLFLVELGVPSNFTACAFLLFVSSRLCSCLHGCSIPDEVPVSKPSMPIYLDIPNASSLLQKRTSELQISLKKNPYVAFI